MAAPPELEQLREQARVLTLTQRCMTCHTTQGKGARQKILDVYNLNNKYWSATMSDQQLKDFARRLTGKMDSPEVQNNTFKVLKPKEMRTIELFVESELEFRRTNPHERQREITDNSKKNLEELLFKRSP
jgi:hypothetical protein